MRLAQLLSTLEHVASGINARLTPVANAQTAAIAKGVRGTAKLMGFAPSAAGNAGRTLADASYA